ncbi:unnamed protein product, partial [Effrenium voratum]
GSQQVSSEDPSAPSRECHVTAPAFDHGRGVGQVGAAAGAKAQEAAAECAGCFAARGGEEACARVFGVLAAEEVSAAAAAPAAFVPREGQAPNCREGRKGGAWAEEEKPPPKEPIVPAVREIPRVRLPRPRQAQKELPENVATLYGKFKGPLMLKYLKELEASDKVTAWRLNEILSLPNEAECESERTDRDKADWIDVGGPVSRQGAWTPCAVDVAVSNANCAARFSSLCQDAKTIESCCAEQVLAQVTAEIDMCKAPPPTNKCDGLYGAEGLQCAWEEDAKSCVEQSCKGCGGEQCQLCRADAQRIAGCCDDHYHSVDPPQICKDSKEEAVTSCMDSKCRGCGGEQCQLCREDAKSECCTGAMRTPSCESK